MAPQNLGIDPVEAEGNDSSFGIEWKARQMGSNHTWGCVVSAVDDAPLTIHVVQLPYNRTLKGAGSLEVVAIPVAASGTRGSLTVRNETTGASAEFSWTWGPFKAQHAAPRANTTASKPVSQAAVVTQAAATGLTRAAAVGQRATKTTVQQAFFGMPAAGGRVAFILDMSGSMAGVRWETCKAQLRGVLAGLQEGFEFYVVLFSDRLAMPPGQEGWTPVSPEAVGHVSAWLDKVSPDGGTIPRPAFERLYSQAAGPTTVFFLTDGEFFGFTAADCARIQQGGGDGGGGGMLRSLRTWFSGSAEDPPPERAVINTITLDDAASGAVMQEIAADSGGKYVHATSK